MKMILTAGTGRSTAYGCATGTYLFVKRVFFIGFIGVYVGVGLSSYI